MIPVQEMAGDGLFAAQSYVYNSCVRFDEEELWLESSPTQWEQESVKRFAVTVVDTGAVVWVGDAENALRACALAARAGNPDVGPFFSHFGSHADDFDLQHLVLNAYDVTALEAGATRDFLSTHDDLLTEDLLAGTFAARYDD